MEGRLVALAVVRQVTYNCLMLRRSRALGECGDEGAHGGTRGEPSKGDQAAMR